MSKSNTSKGHKRSLYEANVEFDRDKDSRPHKRQRQGHSQSAVNPVIIREPESGSANPNCQGQGKSRIQDQCLVCEELVDLVDILFCSNCQEEEGCRQCLHKDESKEWGQECAKCATYWCEPCWGTFADICYDCFGVFCHDCMEFKRYKGEQQCNDCQPFWKRHRPASDFCSDCGSSRSTARFCRECGLRFCEQCDSFCVDCDECEEMECEDCCEMKFCGECEVCYCADCWLDECPRC